MLFYYLFIVSFFIKINSSSEASTTSWTVMIYMSARNDLAPFAQLNLQQMQQAATNKNLKIIVRLNTVENENNATHTILIKKNKLIFLPAPTDIIDSADPKNIIEFCKYVICNFKSKHYALIFWDHGTGPLTYIKNKTKESNTNEFNIINKKYKGLCFDDTSMKCLSENDIKASLIEIVKYLPDKKLDIIGFDACSMATIEVAYNVARFATYMIGSQTLEPATGWNYEKIFSLFFEETPQPKKFAQHIVSMYQENYPEDDTATLSAIDLRFIEAISHALSNATKIITLFPYLLKNQKSESKEIEKINFKNLNIYFDLIQIIKNTLKNIDSLKEKSVNFEKLIKELKNHLLLVIRNIELSIIANSAKNKNLFTGISIYLPNTKIDTSYTSIDFYKNTNWIEFITAHLQNKNYDSKKRI